MPNICHTSHFNALDTDDRVYGCPHLRKQKIESQQAKVRQLGNKGLKLHNQGLKLRSCCSPVYALYSFDFEEKQTELKEVTNRASEPTFLW